MYVLIFVPHASRSFFKINTKLRKEEGLAVNSSPNIFHFYTWKENEVRNGKCHVNVTCSHKKRLSIKCIL